jgi:hypothetical protein
MDRKGAKDVQICNQENEFPILLVKHGETVGGDCAADTEGETDGV